MSATILTNARIVTADAVVSGTLVVADGRIVAVDSGRSGAPGARDMEGDYLLPGLVELHTDNLERHTTPRPAVHWPRMAAVLAHDGQMAAAGITTVLDAVRLGCTIDDGESLESLAATIEAIEQARNRGLGRAEHFIHLRCEIGCADTLEQFEALVDAPLVRLVSVMDHTPGQRQFVDPERLRVYYTRKYGMSDERFDRFTAERREAQARYARRHRAGIVEHAQQRGIALASHDDATPEHVAEAIAEGMSIAEFPTSLEAAELAHRYGLAVLVGGPNVVLGGSHSGNIAATDLVNAGLADIVSSDYVPSSLMQAAFAIARGEADLPRAVAMVSSRPARAVGMADRGALTPGSRADVARVRAVDGLPQVREVLRGGERVI
ncbi:MAG: alpha-D-ribose 1-methylphosphonate 5-triphosphate diphosphatase [Alphaproteobacteria bacterium]|nr:alpha-D-ribose 1-methylphosphonate 5-triphosphate diphosphatase [Alphaproteobacteria bacterium]